MWLDQFKSLELPQLTKGSHKEGSKELCLMELIAFMERESHSDKPNCVCDTLVGFGIMLNDTAPGDDFRQRLLRLAPMLVGTKTDDPHRAMVRLDKDPYAYEMMVERKWQHGRMHERITSPSEKRADRLAHVAETLARLIGRGFSHGDREMLRDYHPYSRAHAAAKIAGECLHNGRGDMYIDMWLMAHAAYEGAILCGPHTPENRGWVKKEEKARAKEWVKEFAVA